MDVVLFLYETSTGITIGPARWSYVFYRREIIKTRYSISPAHRCCVIIIYSSGAETLVRVAGVRGAAI